MTTHGGVMFRIGGELHFLPSSIALKVLPTPQMARVPGGPPELRGVALVDGDMIPIVEVERTLEEDEAPVSGPLRRPPGAMLVCSILGERVGVVGIEVVASGRFDVDPGSGELRHGRESARTFDLGGVIAKVRESRWAV